MNAIETNSLTKHYGTHVAVDDLNLSVAKGSICGFLGKNGAGKTTTIKMLTGLTKPTSGVISLSGVVRKYGSNNNSNIGYLPDVPNFYEYMTAREYLNFCGKLYAIEGKRLKACIDDLLKQVGLFNNNKNISTFSRGMKQRLGIAQALINEPDVIFLDEPISALDPIGRNEVMTLIRSLRGNITVFFSTHILTDIENTCDHVLILEKGKVLADDTIVRLKQKYADNTAFLRLYTPDDGNRFSDLALGQNDLTVEPKSPTEFILKADNLNVLGKRISFLLTEANISMESFQAYTPSLDDIFIEMTGGVAGE